MPGAHHAGLTQVNVDEAYTVTIADLMFGPTAPELLALYTPASINLMNQNLRVP
jgi:hypothetical protein